MSEFSRDRIAGEVCLPCQQFNLFRFSIADGIECDSVISCSVGGKPTPSWPENYTFRFPNSLAETSGPLDVTVDGKTVRIFDDVGSFGRLRSPEDLRMHFILERAPVAPMTPAPHRPPSYVPVGQVSSARMPGQMGLIERGHEMNALDVMSETAYRNAGSPIDAEGNAMAIPSGGDPYIINLEVPDIINLEVPEGNLPDGEYTIAELTNEAAALLRWAIHETLSETTGVVIREAGEAALGYRQMLREGNNRRFLQEMAGTKLRLSRLGGARVLSFVGDWNKAMLWYRPHLRYGARGLGNMQVTSMALAVQGVGANVHQAVRTLGSRGGALGLLFVCTLDVVEWLSGEGEKELDELLISLGFTLGAAVIAAIVGTAAAAGFVALAGVLAVPLAPVAIAVLGFGFVAAVGMALGFAINASGVKAKALEAYRETMARATINQPDFQNSDLYQGMMVAP